MPQRYRWPWSRRRRRPASASPCPRRPHRRLRRARAVRAPAPLGHRLDAYLDLVRRLGNGDVLFASAWPCTLRCVRCRPEALTAVMARAWWTMPPSTSTSPSSSARVQTTSALRRASGRLAARPRPGRRTLDPGTPRTCPRARCDVSPTTGAVAGLADHRGQSAAGLFPLKAYLDAGGVSGIGSDSHISVSRWRAALAGIRPAPARRATTTSP